MPPARAVRRRRRTILLRRRYHRSIISMSGTTPYPTERASERPSERAGASCRSSVDHTSSTERAANTTMRWEFRRLIGWSVGRSAVGWLVVGWKRRVSNSFLTPFLSSFLPYQVNSIESNDKKKKKSRTVCFCSHALQRKKERKKERKNE